MKKMSMKAFIGKCIRNDILFCNEFVNKGESK